MKFGRYSVVIKGTKETAFFHGFNTLKEAREIKEKLETTTGIEHEIFDYKTKTVKA